jgi:hypothetical protein
MGLYTCHPPTLPAGDSARGGGTAQFFDSFAVFDSVTPASASAAAAAAAHAASADINAKVSSAEAGTKDARSCLIINY